MPILLGEEDVGDVEAQADVHTLFAAYNELYFEGRLGGTCVEWSDRMTLCAGICYLRRQGGARYCVIRLSRPLLQYRPYADVRSTLLHEMIHAYLWVDSGQLDRDGHGLAFQALATRINEIESGTGVSVTIYHTFYAEVAVNRQHVWRCQGPCKEWPPYFGHVRRAMNRVPQPADRWWREHQATCGGVFVKIHEPARGGSGRMRRNDSKGDTQPGRGPPPPTTISDYFAGRGRVQWANDAKTQGHQCPSCRSYLARDLKALNDHLDNCLDGTGELAIVRDKAPTRSLVDGDKRCPVCDSFASDNMDLLNDHIDACIEGRAASAHAAQVIDLT